MIGSHSATIPAAASAAPERIRLTGRQRLTLVGSVSGILIAAVVGSQAAEFFINRVLRPDLEEWSWISEVLMTLAFLAITTLWIRLRMANTVVEVLEHERLRSQAELAVAANVQRALLPPTPPALHGVSWFAAMEPAGVVGGDYYDFFRLAGDRMAVVVADVSGKGVPAAVFVSNARAVIRAVAREATATPSQILTSVSEVVLADSRGDLYVTAFVAIVDTVNHTMRFANAGHPPAVVIGRTTRPLTAGGPPLGLIPDAHYDEALVILEPNDLVVIVSDGVTDGLNATGDGIVTAIEAAIGRRNRTPESACGAILAEARRGPGPADVGTWTDDRTALAFRMPASFD